MKCLQPYLCVILAASVAGCGHSLNNLSRLKFSESKVLMGTVVKIDVCYDQPEHEKLREAMASAWARLEDIGWRMNVLDGKSDVAKINNSFRKPVSVRN